MLHKLVRIFRVSEWWEFKVGPILALVYATSLQSRESLFSIWPTLVGIVVALASLGAFANTLNDWTDIAEDRSSGKPNRMADKPLSVPILILILTSVVGWTFALWLRPGFGGLILYAVNTLAFVLYSVPPIRLKVRGVFGLLADAAGVHTLPALFAIVTFATASGDVLHPIWIALVTVWSLAYGLRGILWHQIADYENDRRANVCTFVSRVGPDVARRLGEYVIFPLEIVALAGLLWWIGSPIPLAFLILDVLLAWRDHPRANRIIVARRPSPYRIILHDFNIALLPVSLLMTSTIYHPRDVVILIVHVLLFPKSLTIWVLDYGKAFTRPRRSLKHRA